jgi:uncharacterized protein (DUF4213/DUF364 family)
MSTGIKPPQLKKPASTVVQRWIHDLKQLLGTETLTLSEVRVGVFYTAAQISSGHLGVAFTPRGLTDTVCCPKSAASAPPAGTLIGRGAWEAAEFALSPSALRRSVGVAVLNALSAYAMERFGVRGGKLVEGLDALDAAEIRPDDVVAMVGAFTPFIKKLKGHVRGILVIDGHPEALKPDELGMWRTPYQAAETIAEASVVIISGSAMVEGEIDSLLSAASRARRVIMAGPTASPWPPPFFDSGIDVLGGIRVRDAKKMLQLVAEGGSGYFFGEAAEKICVLREHTIPLVQSA